MPRIGVISDTHNFLDPQVADWFAGVEHILHAGDIGRQRILAELEMIAPVTAVIGNTDDGLIQRETEVIELLGRKFLLHHIVNPHAPTPELRRRLEAVQPDVVVFGHTHQPFCERIQGRLFLNPGSAGQCRFSTPRSLAVIRIEGTELEVDFHDLER